MPAREAPRPSGTRPMASVWRSSPSPSSSEPSSQTVIYGAMQAVPRAQLETAEAYGMSRAQVFRRILVPQMWVYALPGLGQPVDDPDQGHAASCSCWASRTSSITRVSLAGPRRRSTNTRMATGGCGTSLGFWSSTWSSLRHLRNRHQQGSPASSAMVRPPRAAKPCERPPHDLLGDHSGLRPAFDRDRREPSAEKSDFTICQQFTLIGSGMIWNLYFGVLALCLRLLSGQCHRAWPRHARSPLDPQTGRVVRLRLPRLALVHPVLPGLRGAGASPQGVHDFRGRDQHVLDHTRLGWGPFGAVPEHGCLFRRDLPWRAEVDPQGATLRPPRPTA